MKIIIQAGGKGTRLEGLTIDILQTKKTRKNLRQEINKYWR